MNRKNIGLLEVFKREIGFILKDKDIITIILLSPIFYAFFYGTVYLNKSEENVPVVIVDMDRSELSQTFSRSLDAHQLVSISEVVGDLNTAIDRIYSYKAHGIVFIPKDFESNLKSGRGCDLKIYLNTTRFLISNDINKALNEVTGTMSATVRLKYFQAQGSSFEQAKEMTDPLNGEVKSLFNPVESYGDFLIPALLVLILQQTLLIGLAESIAKERESGMLGNLYDTANKSIWAVISGKGIFYLLLYASYAILFYTLHFLIFRLNFKGSVTPVIFMSILFLIAVIYIAIFISSFFKRKIVSLQVFAFTSYPVLLISGYPWPQQTMPVYIRYLSFILPSTPYLNALSRVTQMGAGWADVSGEIIHLMILCLSGLVLTRIRFGRLLKGDMLKNNSIYEDRSLESIKV